MYWFNSILRNDNNSIYMNIFELLNTFDMESQTIKNEIKNYEDPMNISPRSKAINNQASFLTSIYKVLGLRNV